MFTSALVQVCLVGVLGLCLLVFSKISPSRKSKHGGKKEPPQVPYSIPWLGSVIPFLNDNAEFITWINAKFPNDGITTLKLATTKLYLVTDANLASQIYRNAKLFAFDPLPVMISHAFGCSKSDLALLEPGSHASNGESLLSKLHTSSITSLQGPGLEAMTSVFIRTLSSSLDAAFPPSMGQKKEEEWKEIDLVQFIKRQWTLASIVSLYGTKIIEQIGPDTIVDWMWEFDIHIPLLIAGFPGFLLPKAVRCREFGLDLMVRWEREAKAISAGFHSEEGEGAKVWDEYWGLDFCYSRGRLAEESGMSERGRAAIQLALLWGQNANAVPAASWLVIQALAQSNASLLPTLLREIEEARREDADGWDIPQLVKKNYLESFLMETYRWSVSSPGVRVVEQDTELGDYVLRKGAMTMVHARTLQLDPRAWGDDALQFRPLRFLPSSESREARGKGAIEKDIKKLRTTSLRPFGGGLNLCPGRHFASNEILAGFAVLMQKLEIEILPRQLEKIGFPEVELKAGKQGGLWPDRPFMVRMRSRG